MSAPLYFSENSHGKLGFEFAAVDRDTNSRAAIIQAIRDRSIDPRKIIEVTEPCDEHPLGRVVDVTDELIKEAEQSREPDEVDNLRQQLLDYDRDHRRDLLKHGLRGW